MVVKKGRRRERGQHEMRCRRGCVAPCSSKRPDFRVVAFQDGFDVLFGAFSGPVEIASAPPEESHAPGVTAKQS